MFTRIPNYERFELAGGGEKKPVATLFDREQDVLVFIAMNDEGYSLYVPGDGGYITTDVWMKEVIAMMQMLPLPDALEMDDAGGLVPPGPDELPNYWSVWALGNHKFKCLEFVRTGSDIASRRTTGKFLRVRSIIGAQHQYIVEDSDFLPNLTGKRIAFDPTTDKIHVVS